MPAWMQAIIALIKKLKPDITPDEERQFTDDVLKAVPKPADNPTKPKDAPTVDTPPADQSAAIAAAVAEAMKPLLEKIGSVEQFTEAQKQASAAAALAAQEKRYTDHIEKLFADHKISKAEKDSYLAKEKQDAKLKVLDDFIEDSGKWPVNPAFAKEGGAPAQQKSQQQQQQQQQQQRPANRAERMRQLEQAATDEIVANM